MAFSPLFCCLEREERGRRRVRAWLACNSTRISEKIHKNAWLRLAELPKDGG